MKKNLIKKNSKWIGTFLFLSFAVSIFFFGQINVTKASILNAILDSAQNQTSQSNTQTNTTSSGSGSILNAILDSAQNQTNNTCQGNQCQSNTSNTVPTASTPVNKYPEPSCPFSPQANRTIVNLNTWLAWGSNPNWNRSVSQAVNLPAGRYNISLFAWDGYAGRPSVSQKNESYFIEIKNGNNIIFQSAPTPDLRDGVETALYSAIVNSNILLSQTVNTITAKHSNYINMVDSANSVYAGCVAFDQIITETPIPTLSASCSVNPSTVNIGGTLNWGVNVSGGTGSYTYSWSGTDGLTSTFSSVFKSYSTAGTKTGTVTITSGSQSITRTCSAVVNTPTPTLSASCSVNPSAVNIGGTLSWGVNASGGTGSYTYSWSGTDGLTSNSPFVSKSYSTAGTKTGTVTITSGSQSITQTCSAVVNQNIVVNDLTVSCSVNPSYVEVYDDVNWRANASGGTGSYTYSWSGTNSLSGSNRNIVWSYNTSGTKRGTVTVTSGGQSASASCTVIVEEENINDDLTVSCYANPTNVQVGSQMNWYAQVRGGNGDYRYSWTGTDGLNSSSRSPAMTYYTVGNKTATVVVRDGDGQRVSRTCNIYVGQNTVLAFSQVNQPPLAQAVYLNQVPYTGVADNYKTAIFMGILALISAWIAYAVIAYKKNNQINFN